MHRRLGVFAAGEIIGGSLMLAGREEPPLHYRLDDMLYLVDLLQALAATGW